MFQSLNNQFIKKVREEMEQINKNDKEGNDVMQAGGRSAIKVLNEENIENDDDTTEK